MIRFFGISENSRYPNLLNTGPSVNEKPVAILSSTVRRRPDKAVNRHQEPLPLA